MWVISESRTGNVSLRAHKTADGRATGLASGWIARRLRMGNKSDVHTWSNI